METISKARQNAAGLRRTNRRVDARAKALRLRILSILQRYGLLLSKQAVESVESGRALQIAKADSSAKLKAEMAALLAEFGLRQMRSSAGITAGTVGVSLSVPPSTRKLMDAGAPKAAVASSLPPNLDPRAREALIQAYEPGKGASATLDAARKDLASQTTGERIIPRAAADRFLATKEREVERIFARTSKAVTASVSRVVAAAADEEPQPSIGEVARRIRNQFHGVAGAGGEVVSEADVSVGPPNNRLRTTRFSTDKGTMYALSSERASVIARTELARAENLGVIEGYKATGVEGLEWISFQDNRSGRGHDRMNGKKVLLGELFVLPDRTRMRWPHDTRGPAKHTINCRCSTKPWFPEGKPWLKGSR